VQSKAEAEDVRVPSNIDVLVCELCTAGYHEDKIILCDQCDKGFHLFCLSPPLDTVPDGEWVCPLCKEAEAETYAFKPGYDVTFTEFEKLADKFKRNFWGGDAKAKQVSSVAQQC
jgi:histone demethylase JARID1